MTLAIYKIKLALYRPHLMCSTVRHCEESATKQSHGLNTGIASPPAGGLAMTW